MDLIQIFTNERYYRALSFSFFGTKIESVVTEIFTFWCFFSGRLISKTGQPTTSKFGTKYLYILKLITIKRFFEISFRSEVMKQNVRQIGKIHSTDKFKTHPRYVQGVGNVLKLLQSYIQSVPNVKKNFQVYTGYKKKKKKSAIKTIRLA